MLGPDMRARIKILGFESFFNLYYIDWICEGVILRPILASSGTSPCWVQACALESKFWALSHSLTYIKLIGFAKVWNYGQFWSPQGPLAAGSGHAR